MVPSNTALDSGPGPPGEGEIWGSEPAVRSDVAYRQITLSLVIRVIDLLQYVLSCETDVR